MDSVARLAAIAYIQSAYPKADFNMCFFFGTHDENFELNMQILHIKSTHCFWEKKLHTVRFSFVL